MRKCSLEDLERRDLNFPHADYVIKCKDVVVVVEETERSKLDDIEALEKTIEWVLSNQHLTPCPRIYAVVHHHRAADPHMSKALVSRMQSARRRRRNVIYWSVRCKSKYELVRNLNSKFNLSISL
jgi:hypothetical protein